MSKHNVLPRLALSIALTLSAASLVAFAGEASETTDIEVTANGVSEKVSIANLKVGETRQLYSEAGTLVTATRTAETLELDIAGDKTSIKMIEPSEMGDVEIAALLEAHGADAKDGEKRIVRIHRDTRVDGEIASDSGVRKIVLVKAGEGEVHELDADTDAVFVKHLGEPGAKQVIVKRRVVKADADSK